MATEPAVLQESLFVLQVSRRHANFFEEHSRRTADSVVNPSPRTTDSVANPSRRFLISISRRNSNQKSMKIGELQAHLAIILQDSKNLRGLSQIE